jgi:D-3-phosphoglycerate dehydrogenase
VSFRILVSDNVHQQGIDLLKGTKGFQVDIKTDLSRAELLEIIGNYDALVVGPTVPVDAEAVQAASRLKVIGIGGGGQGKVDIREATRRGVVVMSTPGRDSIARAEHTIALLMALHRHIAQATTSMKDGKWEKKKFQGREIAGRTLGVIGLGEVGSLVCGRAGRGLKMQVLAYDPAIGTESASRMGAKLVPLDELFARSDVISVHTPLNDETRGLINSNALEKMKPGVIIINCARGGIIDEEALLEALQSERVAAAGLDAYATEPPGEHPLVMHPRVIATPHLSDSTTEAQINVSVAVAQQIIGFLEKGLVSNAVNFPTTEPSEVGRIGPYLDLARKLAQVLSWLAPEPITEIEVQYTGELAGWNLKPITNSALMGLFTRFEGLEVNEVNAAMIAAERGPDVESSLTVRTSSADGTSRSLRGTLIRREGYEPRITGIDEFITEAVPAGPMLITTNRDVPGMIAGISGALAARGVNIAQMNLSRECKGGTALSIINVDEPVDEATLDAIRNIEGILSVKQVILDQ